MSELHALQLTDLEGNERSLSDYAGKVLLLVNVASRCGKTPQYKGLEELHQRYQERGFSVMGFPCNQFGKQEPGTAQEIRQFCDLNYGVTFPIFAKLEVNGSKPTPALCASDRANRCISRKDHLELREIPSEPRRRGTATLFPKNNSERSGADSSPGSAALSYVLF